MKRVVLAVTISLAASGCATAGAAAAPRKAAPAGKPAGRTAPLTPLLPATRACPKGNGGTAIIDYVDFVTFEGRTYIGQLGLPVQAPPASLLGAPVGAVRCELSTIQPAPTYQATDGDAGFLPAGTPVLAVRGYPTSFRLAALRDGKYRIYEVDTAPRARIGGDLLPLSGLVRSIDIIDADTQTKVVGRVSDPREIASLVAALVRAPVDQAKQAGETTLELRLHLRDGTTVLRGWHPKELMVDRGILLPPSANQILQRAINR